MMEDEQLSLVSKGGESANDRSEREIVQAIYERFETMKQEWQEYQDDLESRLELLEAINASAVSPENLERLKALQLENRQLTAENKQLTQALETAQGKLDRFRQLLLGESSNEVQFEEETVPKPEPKAVEKNSSDKPPRKKKGGRRPGQAMKRAGDIFHRVQAWNRQHPDETFAINPGFLETVFRINRKAAKQFCEEFKTEIWEHHQEIGVEHEVSHNRGKDVDALLAYFD